MSKVSRYRDRTGERSGNLVYVKFSHTKKGRSYWVAKCDCGNLVTVRTHSSKSCGCVRANLNIKRKLNKNIISDDDFVDHYVQKESKKVFKHYSDGNLSYERFLELSQENCYYCNNSLSNSANPFVKKDGSVRYTERVSSIGVSYKRRTSNRDISLLKKCSFKYNGLDRIDQSKLHDEENVVPCCYVCNYMKRDMSRDDFESKIKEIYKWILKKN